MVSSQRPVLNSLHLKGPPAATRVVVAMSGGVDSSVVAALMKAEGYDVVGVTLQLYDHGEAVGRKGACCAGQDIQDARRVADKLQIPHYVLDYEARFAQAVMGEFADSYLQGETPVPCIACNQKIKFHDLLETASSLGASALATGHYVRSGPGSNGWELYRAADTERDQSYFLFATTRKQLAFLRFPLGALHKDATRKLARDFGLGVAEKSDSQDICFVPTGRYTEVIERLRPGAAEAGNIVHVDGRVLGRHGGIINYTIGQRKGIGVPAQEPLYVLRLDASAREVVVGPREALRTRRLKLRDVNWLGDEFIRGVRGERGGNPRPNPIERTVAAGALEHRRGRFHGRARSWRGRRVPRTGLCFLCRRWRWGAASRRWLDQVHLARRKSGSRRLCGARGQQRDRKGAGGRIAVRRQSGASRSERERGS